MNHNMNSSNDSSLCTFDNLHINYDNKEIIAPNNETESFLPVVIDKSLDSTDGLYLQFNESVRKLHSYEIQKDDKNYNSSNTVFDNGFANKIIKTINYKHYNSLVNNENKSQNMRFEGHYLNTENDSSITTIFASFEDLNGNSSTIDLETDISETIVSTSETNYSAHYKLQRHDLDIEIQPNKVSVNENVSLSPPPSLFTVRNFCSNFHFSDKIINKTLKHPLRNETFRSDFDKIDYVTTINENFGYCNMPRRAQQSTNDSGIVLTKDTVKVGEASIIQHSIKETYSINEENNCEQHLSINVVFDSQQWFPLGSSFGSSDRNCTLSSGSFCEPLETPKRYCRPGKQKKIKRDSTNLYGINPNNDEFDCRNKCQSSKNNDTEPEYKHGLPNPFPCLFSNRISGCFAEEKIPNLQFTSDQIVNEPSPYLMIVKENDDLPLHATLRHYENDKNEPPFKVSVLSNASTENISVKHNDKFLKPATSNEAPTKKNTRQSIESTSKKPNRQNEPSTSRMPSRASEDMASKKQPRQSIETQPKKPNRPSQETMSKMPSRASQEPVIRLPSRASQEMASKKQPRQSIETQPKKPNRPSQETLSKLPSRASNDIQSKSTANATLRTYENEKNAPPFKAAILSNASTENISVTHNNKLLKPTTSNEFPAKQQSRMSNEAPLRKDTRSREDLQSKKTNRTNETASKVTTRSMEFEKKTPLFKNSVHSEDSIANVSLNRFDKRLKLTGSEETETKIKVRESKNEGILPRKKSGEITERNVTKRSESATSVMITVDTADTKKTGTKPTANNTPIKQKSHASGEIVPRTTSHETNRRRPSKELEIDKRSQSLGSESGTSVSIGVKIESGGKPKKDVHTSKDTKKPSTNDFPIKHKSRGSRETTARTGSRETNVRKPSKETVKTKRSQSVESQSVGTVPKDGKKKKGPQTDKDTKTGKPSSTDVPTKQKSRESRETAARTGSRETAARTGSRETNVRKPSKEALKNKRSQSAESQSVATLSKDGRQKKGPQTDKDPKKGKPSPGAVSTKQKSRESRETAARTGSRETTARTGSRETNVRKPSKEALKNKRSQSVESQSVGTTSKDGNKKTGPQTDKDPKKGKPSPGAVSTKQKSRESRETAARTGSRETGARTGSREAAARTGSRETAARTGARTGSRETNVRKPSKEAVKNKRSQSLESQSVGTTSKDGKTKKGPQTGKDAKNTKHSPSAVTTKQKSRESRETMKKMTSRESKERRLSRETDTQNKNKHRESGELIPRRTSRETDQRNALQETELQIRMESVESESATSVSIGIKVEISGKPKSFDNVSVDVANIASDSKTVKQKGKKDTKAKDQENVMVRSVSNESLSLQIDYNSTADQSRSHQISINIEMKKDDKQETKQVVAAKAEKTQEQTVSRSSHFFPEIHNDRPNVCVIPVVNCRPYITNRRKTPEICQTSFSPCDFQYSSNLTPRRLTKSDLNIPCAMTNAVSTKDRVCGDFLHKTPSTMGNPPVCERRRSVSSINDRCGSVNQFRGSARSYDALYVRQNDIWPQISRRNDAGIPLPYGYSKEPGCSNRIHPVIQCQPNYNYKPFFATYDRIPTPRTDCLNCTSCNMSINYKNRNEHIEKCLNANINNNTNNNDDKEKNPLLKSNCNRKAMVQCCTMCRRNDRKTINKLHETLAHQRLRIFELNKKLLKENCKRKVVKVSMRNDI